MEAPNRTHPDSAARPPSGFGVDLHVQVLRALLRRQGRAVKVLARGMGDYRPTAEERELLAAGRMLIITACPPEVHRVTRETAVVILHDADDSPPAALLEEKK